MVADPYVGLLQVLVPGVMDPQTLQHLTVQRRKEIQKQRLREYEDAIITLKAKVKDAEGQAMRETVQDKVTPQPWACGAVSAATVTNQLSGNRKAASRNLYLWSLIAAAWE